MYNLKTISTLVLFISTTNIFGQNYSLPKLSGLWLTADSQQLFIDNYSDNGSYLANDTIIKSMSVFLYEDTLSFKKIHIGGENAFETIDTIWYSNEFIFKLLKFNDSIIYLKSLSENSKWLFDNVDTLIFQNHQIHYDSTIQFEKLEYSTSFRTSSGSLGMYRIKIDSKKILIFESIDFRNNSFDDPTDVEYSDSVIIRKVQITKDTLFYEELINILRVCNLNYSELTTDSVFDSIRDEQITIYFNGTKRQYWKGDSNVEGIRRLFQFLHNVYY